MLEGLVEKGEEELKKKGSSCCPHSSGQSVADDTGEAPLRGTLLYKKNHSAERSGKLERRGERRS